MQDRGHLLTERRNRRSEQLDTLSVAEAFDVMNAEDASIASAVARARRDICAAVELVVAAFKSGGRLIYVGAGTSGRLGVLDASECPPTFLSDPTMVQGIIAGGDDALRRSIEGAEDVPEDGAAAMDAREVGPDDVVFGIATGGTTPYVHGALDRARQLGAKTVFFGCVDRDQVGDTADVSIRVLVGPEVVTGSTRLKAGTATKMVLNQVSTLAMVQTGKVFGNLMVDVNTQANAKLVERGRRIIETVTGLEREQAGQLLDRAAGRVKIALVMHARKVTASQADRLLAEHVGHLGRILDDAL
ncbi:MAG: N-acetylmuramic acid 6-phosphate etherase [Phycisphaerae bacterium]